VSEDAAPYSRSCVTGEGERDAPGSDFGRLLRGYRLSFGLSQEALAERARMSSDGISALERGYRRSPQRETIALLAGALTLSDEERQAFEGAAARPKTIRRSPSVTAGPWPPTAVSNLPAALKSFIGRELELDEIAELVRRHRLVTVIGAGGIGKTQTALQTARILSEVTGATVRVALLASISDPALVLAAVASALDLQEAPNQPLLETVTLHLRNRALLLILDNCEHVAFQAATAVEALLPACPRLRILATSRERLRVTGEHAYLLPPLTASASFALFVDRATAVEHSFVLNEEEVPIITDVCRRLDGIPLAIELAAARSNVFSISALAAALDGRLGVLSRGERTAPPRQQTLHATIEWSYNLLSPEEQRVFERLSVFIGGATLEAATTVCADRDIARLNVLALVTSLVDKSLLVCNPSACGGRYHMLEPFRHYANQRLDARADRPAVTRRHALACLELAERLDRDYYADPLEVWPALAYEEVSNWRAAIDWALLNWGDVDLGGRLVAMLPQVVWALVTLSEASRWTDAALALADTQTPESQTARLNHAKAIVFQQADDYESQIRSSVTAIAAYQIIGDRLGVVRAQSIASHALASSGHVAEAKALLDEALRLVRDLGKPKRQAYVLRCLGFANAMVGDIVAARDFAGEALRLYQSANAALPATWVLGDLAQYEFCAGNAELALRFARDALSATRRIADARSGRAVAAILGDMAVYLCALARYDEAVDHALEALDLARAGRLSIQIARVLQHLAVITALRPRPLDSEILQARAGAACVLGFVNARISALGSSRWRHQQQEYDGALAVLHETLGADQAAQLMTVGAAMIEDEAIEEALAWWADSG
jgi:predicted ATPase